MSSGLGPRSRSMFDGSERPGSACTVSCVSSGVLSSPLPREYCTLNSRPLPSRLFVPIVSDLNVDDPIDCTSWIVLKRGSRRVDAFTAVLYTGRPSASTLVGLIGLMFVTTGRLLPRAYITPANAVKSRPTARSTWTFDCHVWATTKSGSTVHTALGSVAVPAEAAFGNAGAPGVVPLKLYGAERDGAADCPYACSYPPRIGWSYMMPVLARTTVFASAAHATP